MTEYIIKLLFGPVAHHSSFLLPLRRYQIPRGTPSTWAKKTRVGGKILRFSTEIAVYLGTVQARPLVAMEC